ncbi:MAG: alkaline phosphatase family protein [Acidobacteria bacterium]|nr:alkaline phosphatase family protein [Acidobacteriota bacterium]
MIRSGIRSACWFLFAVLFHVAPVLSQPRRLVILKVDGLPGNLIERHLGEIRPDTGKPRLPWIHHVFLRNGTWIRNFYVRGISLSAPSWCMLDTGGHAIIRSNAEFDRLTGRVYDYVNFFPFYVSYARSRRADMPGVEVLDEAGLSLLLDSYSIGERYQGFQLYQRGVRWSTLGRSFNRGFLLRSPLALVREWQVGFDAVRKLSEQLEQEFLEKLKDDRLMYLDYFDGDYDHVAHLSNSAGDQLRALLRLDTLVGRVWSAIQDSSLAGQTVLVMVSDHGMNSEESTFSQGYSLLDLFGGGAGGGHHVLMNRHPMGKYKLRGLDPFVSEVVTPSRESFYLGKQADRYPTASMDLDGNERASIHLRNSDWNALHILFQQLERRDLPADLRAAAAGAVLEIIDRHRPAWIALVKELEEELPALRRLTDLLAAKNLYLPKRWSAEDRLAGRDQQARRQRAREDSCRKNQQGYSRWVKALAALLGLDRAALESDRVRVEALIPKRTMGDANTIHDLQNYVVGPGADGLVMGQDGKLDLKRSFRRIDYFALLTGVRVRNVVQAKLGARPVDFVAARVPLESLRPDLPPEERPDEDGVLLYGDDDHQVLLLYRRATGGGLELRYVPVAGFRQDRSGRISFRTGAWGPGFPLRLWEDPDLGVPPEQKETWLSRWHSEAEWMHATHRCLYSNAVIGLHEYFMGSGPEPEADSATPDEGLVRRFERRLRRMVRTDLLVLANNHWNFNVRAFNPGGNHGSFFRTSTRSVFMLEGTGVPRGLVIEEPCDSLRFVPTVLKLAGREPPRGMSGLAGRPIEELFSVATISAGAAKQDSESRKACSPARTSGLGLARHRILAGSGGPAVRAVRDD